MTFRDAEGTSLVLDKKGDKMVSDDNETIILSTSGELTLPPLVSAYIRGGRVRVIS